MLQIRTALIFIWFASMVPSRSNPMKNQGETNRWRARMDGDIVSRVLGEERDGLGTVGTEFEQRRELQVQL